MYWDLFFCSGYPSTIMIYHILKDFLLPTIMIYPSSCLSINRIVHFPICINYDDLSFLLCIHLYHDLYLFLYIHNHDLSFLICIHNHDLSFFLCIHYHDLYLFLSINNHDLSIIFSILTRNKFSPHQSTIMIYTCPFISTFISLSLSIQYHDLSSSSLDKI